MAQVKVWDAVIRLLHWSLVAAFVLNAAILDDESAAHAWVGYFIIGLISVRVVWGFVGPQHARFSSFKPDVNAAIQQVRDVALGRRTRYIGHSPLGALMTYNLMVTFLFLGLTGWIMTLPEVLIGHDPEWAEDLHEAAFGWAVFSIIVHIGGVAFMSWHMGVNLARAMITGTKSFDDDK